MKEHKLDFQAFSYKCLASIDATHIDFFCENKRGNKYKNEQKSLIRRYRQEDLGLDQVIGSDISVGDIQTFKLWSDLQMLMVLRKPNGIHAYEIDSNQLKIKF